MPIMKRYKTDYPGVYYIIGEGARGPEKIYYIRYRQDKKEISEKVGRQFQNDMTPAKASGIRSQRIDKKDLPNTEKREIARKEKAGKWTFNKLWNEYYDQRKDTVKGILTDQYRYDKHLKELIGHKEPRELVEMDVTRVTSKMKKRISRKTGKPLATQTIWHMMQLITRLSNFGVSKRYCQGIDFVIRKPNFDNRVTEKLDSDQVKRLIEAIHEDDNPIARMMEIALFTGCRRGELLRLQWSDIDFDNSFITLRDRKGSKGESLHIPMSDTVREILKSLPQSGDMVFPSDDGAIRAQVYHVVNRIKKKAGLPKDFRGFHGLRHAYASLLVSGGTELYVVQNLLGHKDIRMTARYSHLGDKILREASTRAESIINQSVLESGKDTLKKSS